jgi:hypothetical protein
VLTTQQEEEVELSRFDVRMVRETDRSLASVARDLGISEYSSHDLAPQLRTARILPSMGSVADCYDNALAESFFATVKCELFDHQHGGSFDSHHQARLAIFQLHRGVLEPPLTAHLHRRDQPATVRRAAPKRSGTSRMTHRPIPLIHDVQLHQHDRLLPDDHEEGRQRRARA